MLPAWKSTKLHLSLLVIVLLTVVYVAMGMPPDLFAVWGGFILSGAAIYATGNVAGTLAHRGPPAPPLVQNAAHVEVQPSPTGGAEG